MAQGSFSDEAIINSNEDLVKGTNTPRRGLGGTNRAHHGSRTRSPKDELFELDPARKAWNSFSDT